MYAEGLAKWCNLMPGTIIKLFHILYLHICEKYILNCLKGKIKKCLCCVLFLYLEKKKKKVAGDLWKNPGCSEFKFAFSSHILPTIYQFYLRGVKLMAAPRVHKGISKCIVIKEC